MSSQTPSYNPESSHEVRYFPPDILPHLLLGGDELRDVGGVAGLLLVGEALQHGVAHGGGDLVHHVNAAVAGVLLQHTPSQVDSLRRRVHHQSRDH